LKKRIYKGEEDLKKLQQFNAEAISKTDHCGYLHPGDIPHHIYSGNRFYNPVDLITIWEDDNGIAGWLLVNLKYKSFDAQVRPDLRGGDFEREVLELAEERTVQLMHQHQVESEYYYADSFQGDTARSDLLKMLGWQPDGEMPYVLNRMTLHPVTLPLLPEGFSYRSAQGTEDAAALAAVHNGAFGSIWTPESYRQVMESPGYEPERELVIQSPDGTFAAFCVIRYDHLNRMGLFEPVGAHRDYQRRGFGKAIMLFGMQKMSSAGMVNASVAHFGSNEAAKGLYQSCGFRPWHLLDGYKKPFR
jgi:mycothiol synthase